LLITLSDVVYPQSANVATNRWTDQSSYQSPDVATDFATDFATDQSVNFSTNEWTDESSYQSSDFTANWSPVLAYCLPSYPHFVLVALDLAWSVLVELPAGLSY
jgi:hypothetical protein